MITKKPNFFIIGAPKCGTTSMARWLSEHPQIFMSPVKEPHFYSTDLKNRTVKTAQRYQKLFSDVTEKHMSVGEASTWYLFSKVAISHINSEYPDAKFIVMTRNPVEMAHSLYHHNLRVLHEDQPTFKQAWRLQNERAAGRLIPGTCTEPAFLQYYKACALGTLLQNLLSQIPSERVLYISLESMKFNAEVEYRRALIFLHIESDNRTYFPVVNEARIHRSRTIQHCLRLGGKIRIMLGINKGLGLSRFNERAKPKDKINSKFHDELVEVFSEEALLLRNITSVLK